MNRFINALLLFIFLPTLLLVIVIGFDLPVQFLHLSGANLPYKEEILTAIGLIILVINLKRTIRRWMGLRIVKNRKRFTWNVAMSSSRKSRILTYLMLEVVVFAFIGVGLYIVTPFAWMPSIGFLFVAIDNIIFAIYGGTGDRYRIGLSSKALIAADRDVNVLYFNGLREVTIHQQSIYFDYIKGLQLSFPIECIPEDRLDEFFVELEKLIDQDKVFFRRS